MLPGATAKAMTNPGPPSREGAGLARLAHTHTLHGAAAQLLSFTCLPLGSHAPGVYTLQTTPRCQDSKIPRRCAWVPSALGRKVSSPTQFSEAEAATRRWTAGFDPAPSHPFHEDFNLLCDGKSQGTPGRSCPKPTATCCCRYLFASQVLLVSVWISVVFCLFVVLFLLHRMNPPVLGTE